MLGSPSPQCFRVRVQYSLKLSVEIVVIGLIECIDHNTHRTGRGTGRCRRGMPSGLNSSARVRLGLVLVGLGLSVSKVKVSRVRVSRVRVKVRKVKC